jgi:UDP-glucose:(heptosyl)LPS alpha-1,3-glucosyltransferase
MLKRAPELVREQRCDVVVGFGRMIQQDILRCGGGTHRGFLNQLGREAGSWLRLWQAISIYHQSLLRLEKRQFRNPDLRKIIAVSEEVKRDIVANYCVPDGKIAVLYNGVDLQRFQSGRRSAVGNAVRKRWNIPLDSPVVLFVGSGFRRKGLDCLLSVWRSPKLNRVYLLVVGGDARTSRYQSQAKRIGGERIIFAGRRDEVENYYAAADVVTLPSIQEAFGNVVLEALASGLPVVVSRGVGAAELLTGSLAAGVVNHPENSQELEAGLVEALERARDPRESEKARNIAQKYSWQNHFQCLEALLLEIAESRTSRRVA